VIRAACARAIAPSCDCDDLPDLEPVNHLGTIVRYVRTEVLERGWGHKTA
jgi:hypothetical protein